MQGKVRCVFIRIHTRKMRSLLASTRQVSARSTSDTALIACFNDAGVRSISFFGLNVKVYVAGLYTERPLRSVDCVIGFPPMREPSKNSEGNNFTISSADHTFIDTSKTSDADLNQVMQFDFTFLRSIGQGRVTSAWEQQLEHSVSLKYDGYEDDRDAFVSMFGPLEEGGVESVILVGDETHVVDQGVRKGMIRGQNFQGAFLSMWFGERAVCNILMRGLLGVPEDGRHGVSRYHHHPLNRVQELQQQPAATTATTTCSLS